jgi:hypothetical protein
MIAERTRKTIETLSMRLLDIGLKPYHPDQDAIVDAYEIVIEELDKLLFYYEKGTFIK